MRRSQTATVTSGDKSSIGTLLDLVSHCTDLLNESPASSTDSQPTPTIFSTFPSLPLYSSKNLRITATETIEASLLLATTQVGLYGKIGAGPQQGQRGAAFARTLGELGTDLTESIDKAISCTDGGNKVGEKGWLLQLLKNKITSWQ